MRANKFILMASTAFATSISVAQADISVVASIKPVHSLVAGVMEGIGTPNIIVDGAGSPHSYSLKPSQARELQDADAVFWFGHGLETFLEKPLEAISTNAKVVELIDTDGLLKLKFREGGPFSEHDHDDDHKDHDDDHKDHDDDHKDHDDDHKDHDDDHKDHDDDHKDHDDDHKDHDDEHEEHAHGEYDPHIWLDPKNASILVQKISDELSVIDPSNADAYVNNAKKMEEKLNLLVNELKTTLEPFSDEGYIVFHDAYQYFEKRFGVSAIGSVTVSPEILPGAERTIELREKIVSLEASCVFSEPQFEPKIISTLVEGTQVGTGVLDPLGASIENGPDLYFKLIRNMASSLKNCLTKS
jgi:zinc transport system substrate-binding protein